MRHRVCGLPDGDQEAMSDTSSRVETLSNRYPDAERVGPHLVIDKTDWVPGKHPEPQLRVEGQTEYRESYYHCFRCEVQVLSKDDFPDVCEPEGQR